MKNKDKDRVPPLPPTPRDVSELFSAVQGITSGLALIAERVAPAPLLEGEANLPPYNVLDYSLDQARKDEAIYWIGDVITASVPDGILTGISVKLDNVGNSPIDFAAFNPIRYPTKFSQFYLTNSVQSGKTLSLFLGRKAGAFAGETRWPGGLTLTAYVSGQTVIALTSGQYALMSGQGVLISGQGVVIGGGSLISGTVSLPSTQKVMISGQPVAVSGAMVVLPGTQVVQTSGQVAAISGQPVAISGANVIAIMSGAGVLISGQTVKALTSGQIVDIATPTQLITDAFHVATAASGGLPLYSGITKSIIVNSLTNSGAIVVGSISNRPYYGAILSGTGVGFVLPAKGDSISLDVNCAQATGRVFVCAEVSGAVVTFLGLK